MADTRRDDVEAAMAEVSEEIEALRIEVSEKYQAWKEASARLNQAVIAQGHEEAAD